MSAAGAPAPDELPIDVDLIKVLASDSRREILRMLGERRKTLTELAEALGLKKATVLEHLQKLVAAGLIRKLDEDERLWIYYELTPRGKRLVRPERTRFYLILGGTAAAALLLGAVVAASVLLGGPGSQQGSMDPGAGAPAFEARDALAPQTAWRGLDERVDIRIAEASDDATLVLRSLSGEERMLPVVESVATLDAPTLDAMPPADLTMSLRAAEGDALLPQVLRVRDPSIALFPRVVPQGANATIEIALVPPGLPPPANASVLLGDTEHRLVGQSVAFLTFNATSDVQAKVGRLYQSEILAVPAFDAAFAKDGEALVLNVTERGASLADAAVLLDDEPLGRTDANGSLSVAWPAPGDRAIRIASADGRAREVAVRFDVERADVLPPQLRIEALDARLPGAEGMRVRADVFNDGPAEAIVTIAAREGDALLASELVRAPAHGRVEVILVSHLASPQVLDVTAHASGVAGRPFVADLAARDLGSTNATTQYSAASPAAPEADAQADDSAAGAKSYDAYAYRTNGFASAVVARDTLHLAPLASPTGEASRVADGSAQTPALAPLMVVAAVAVAAAALSRKRR